MALQTKHIDQIITRYLSGEATADEAVLLDDWRAESAENERYFAQYLFINNKSLEARPLKKFNVDKAWKTVQTQMREMPEPKAKSARIFHINKNLILQLAAVALIVIGIASVFNYYRGYTLEQQPIAFISTDSIRSIKMADNSNISLNKNSEISYCKNFGKKERRVKLKGEAFFEVQHSAEKPFIVETEGVLIQDIGTSFNIKAQSKSNLVEVYVEDGEVKFFSEKNAGISLIKGEKGVYNKISGCFSKVKTLDANVIAYKTRKFVFSNTPMSEVAETLMEAYEVKIRFANSKLTQLKISVSFDNEDIDAILAIIAETIDGRIENTDNGYLIEEKP